MSDNNLTTKSAGDVISEDDPNQYKLALDGDLLPRDIDGIPSDVGGNLGSTIYRWAEMFIQKIVVGVAAHAVSIEESASALLFKFSGTTAGRITSAGIDGSTLAPLSSLFGQFTVNEQPRWRVKSFFTNGTFAIPANVTHFVVYGCGGGGGGGGGNAGASGGFSGAGGNASRLAFVPISASPGDIWTITIGAGGAGGTGISSNSAGTPGAAGTDSQIVSGSFGGLVLAVFQGVAGGKSSTGTQSAAHEWEVLGGLAGLSAGSNGGVTQGGSPALSGSQLNGANSSGGGGGRNGPVPVLFDGFGGNGNGTGVGGDAFPAVASGCGGGGGGGSGTGARAGNGGNGANGTIQIFWVGPSGEFA